MKFENINVPEPDCTRFPYPFSKSNCFFSHYAMLIRKPYYLEKVLNIIRKDPRVIELEGLYLSDIAVGGSGEEFDPEKLSIWFLWAINEFGQEVAVSHLNNYLDSFEVPVINSLWILGVEVDEPIALSNNLSLVPISEMPDSFEKENFQKIDGFLQNYHSLPVAAITKEIMVTKAGKEEDLETDASYQESTELLYNVALVINAIEGISCIPYFHTTYALPIVPYAFFLGTGGSSSGHDIIGNATSKVTYEQAEEIDDLINSFIALSSNEQKKFGRILSRISQAKRRNQIEDKILDLGISLEMALLDNSNNHQLSLSFRLRGSKFAAKSNEERLIIYRQLKDIYNYRSQVAHSGVLCGGDHDKIKEVRDNYSGYMSVAEYIIKKLICDGKPDWTKLILDLT